MNSDVNNLIDQYLDGMLPENQEAELNAWVKASPLNAAAFAQASRLHDQLHDLILARRVIEQESEEISPAPLSSRVTQRHSFWRRPSFAGAMAALVAVTLGVVWWSHPTPVNAAIELERLIRLSSETADRSYVIHNLDPQPEQDSVRPPIEGATLHVRRPDQYVLIRHFPDGRTFITGSDGEHSWAVPPQGAVRVSGDPLRFRGPVPGNQHGIPFADLRSDLSQLRDAYELTVLPTKEGWHGLLAEKKSRDFRGPRQVKLYYDAHTGIIHRMVFDGLPRGRGGPNSVAVELLHSKDLGVNFFMHESHHPAERQVVDED